MSGPDCGAAGRASVRLRPGRHCGNAETWQASREEEVDMQQILRVAIDARVSSDQQSGDNTIASQVTALEARVSADGLVLPAAQRFVDDGYSGATLAPGPRAAARPCCGWRAGPGLRSLPGSPGAALRLPSPARGRTPPC